MMDRRGSAPRRLLGECLGCRCACGRMVVDYWAHQVERITAGNILLQLPPLGVPWAVYCAQCHEALVLNGPYLLSPTFVRVGGTL